MKNLYAISCFILLGINGIKAQTLTKAANEPVSGDSWTVKEFDSTSVVPKNTGTGQTWNFSNLSTSNQTSTVTYTLASTVPGYSLFPGAGVAELKGGSETGFFKTSGSYFEFMGFYDASGPIALNLSNTAVMSPWPITYGSSFSDPLSGAMTSGTMSINWTGSITTSALGTGTIILPGGNTFTNCLMVVRSISIAIGSTDSYAEKQYSFYNSSYKFPIAEFAYEASTSGTVTSTYFKFKATLSALSTGVDEINGESNAIRVFPNPAQSYLNIHSGTTGNLSVEIRDITCKVILKSNSSMINIEGLDSGLYFLNIQTESGNVTKRLVIQK
jgi:hypothetical protein